MKPEIRESSYFTEPVLDQINSIITTPFLTLGNTSLTLELIAQFMLALLITLVLSLGVKRLLANQILGRLGLKQGTRESIATITSYSVGTLFCIALLQAVGINLASLAVLAGSLGIGIGLGLQDITKHFVSGITLLMEQKLKVGDFIEWNGTSGYITEISLRSTTLRTITQRHIIIPNSDLVSNQVMNWTFSNSKGWVSVPVRVAHESDPLLVIEVLMDSAYLEETVSYEEPPEVYFTEFGDNSLNFLLWVWVHQIDLKHKTESSLRFIIEQNLRQQGIRLASPRLDLWQRNPNVVVQSSPQDYAKQTFLQQPQHLPYDPSLRPVAARDLLQQIPLFAKCSDLELRKLVEIGHRRRLDASEVVYRVGDPGDGFYIILTGAVGYTLQEEDAEPTVLRAGQFIGEFSLMLGIPRTVTVTALEETTLFAISPKGFKQLLQDQPHLYDLIVEEMGKHEEELSQQGRKLRELGLLNSDEYDNNPVAWVRKHLEKLFSL